MIECATKGIPMAKEPDADGFVRFNLDEAKHDPFVVLARLIAATGVQQAPLSPEREALFRQLTAAREHDCIRPRCDAVGRCSMLHRCQWRKR